VRGVQIGVINISSNGVFELGTSWDPQTEYVYGTLKTGNTSVFGIYSVAMPKADLLNSSERMILSAGLGTRVGDSRSLSLDLSASASQELGTDAAMFLDAWSFRHGLTPMDVLAPWPTLDASLSLKMGGLRLTGGVRVDISLESAPNLPAALEKGLSYKATWFGETFTAWSKWYVGIGF